MTLENTSTSSFGNIALCLSGGGFRAATYGLGAIDMLEMLGLLGNVKLMSTVSGGTFTGVTYALSVADRKSYATYFNEFYSFLRDTNCVELALNDLYSTPPPLGEDDLSLIRSAANVYDSKLFDRTGRTFASLQSIVGENKRFLELIHNATEFRKGNSFRFRASHNPYVFPGNGDFKVATDIAAEIRLADIIAASSCFPGAFEPIRFPDDFVWTDGLACVRKQLKKDVHTPRGPRQSGFKLTSDECLSLPLMDGGIYDNQGISNAVEADPTKEGKPPLIDLFLISDTSARADDMLRYPRPDERAGWFSLNTLFWAAVGLFLFSVASAGFLIYYLATAVDTRTLSWTRFIFQYLSPIALFVVLIGLLIWGYRLFRKNKEIVVSGAKFKLWPVVRRLTLADLIDMVKARLTSLGTMAGDVFMKRVRQLEFIDVMSSTNHRSKVAFDLIYDLNPTDDEKQLWTLDPDLEPNETLRKLSACAEAVPTTLWFPKVGEEEIRVERVAPPLKIDEADEEKKKRVQVEPATCKREHANQQRLLLACAQCTTCYSLLRHLWDRWVRESKNDPAIPRPDNEASPFYKTYTNLKEVWKQLKTDPYSFVDRPRT